MQLFRVYMNTTLGRKSLECTAGSPGEASAKGRKLYEGAVVLKVKTIDGYTLPVPPEMTQEWPEPRRMASPGPNIQQIPKRVENALLQREADTVLVNYSSDGILEMLPVNPHKHPVAFDLVHDGEIHHVIVETHGVPAELHQKTT